MYRKLFINDFTTLGNIVNTMLSKVHEYPLWESVYDRAFQSNSFFTKDMQLTALRAVCDKFLSDYSLNEWLKNYEEYIFEREETVGIIMAGNIPLVGFHDFLSALALGYKVEIKLSSKDNFLIKSLFEELFTINGYWKKRIFFVNGFNEDLKTLIAAGSDDTMETLDSKFSHSHRLLRGSRSSIAVLKGDESEEKLTNLANDVFLFFGLGCRSVSTLFIPNSFELTRLSSAFEKFKGQMISNAAYYASYRHKKALLSIENKSYFDGGFYLLSQFDKMLPPMACVNLYRYDNLQEIIQFVDVNSGSIQAVCSDNLLEGSVEFGQMQFPELWDYADGVNTLEFLLNNFS